MDFWCFDCGTIPAVVTISQFKGQSGVEEYHLVIQPTEYGDFETQLKWLFEAYRKALDSIGLDMQSVVLRRFFCSDLLNQANVLKSYPFANPHNSIEPCAVSWVCQPAAPPAKVALWAYHLKDPAGKLDKQQEGKTLILKRNKLTHYWSMGKTSLSGITHYEQTRCIFDKYNTLLRARDMSLADQVIRTWFFVQDIDAYYQGLVIARREYFAEHGLTPETHFIASTGIEGSYSEADARVTMDAYAIAGIQQNQIKYLSAPDHLSPTHIYGVTFERGTSITYQDRSHIFISGTASIDSQGNILHPGDIRKQLDRTLENVDALLKQAGAQLKDMKILIVYVRDSNDIGVVRQQLQDRMGNRPIAITVAAVCRPGWLIEIEGIAIIPTSRPELPAY